MMLVDVDVDCLCVDDFNWQFFNLQYYVSLVAMRIGLHKRLKMFEEDSMIEDFDALSWV